jgi:hypothetical protein
MLRCIFSSGRPKPAVASAAWQIDATRHRQQEILARLRAMRIEAEAPAIRRGVAHDDSGDG